VCRKAGRDENADTTSLAHIVAMTRIIDICTEGKLEILAIVCELIGCVRDDVQINRHNKKELGIAMMPLAYDSITKNKKMMWGWRGNPGTDQKMIFERTRGRFFSQKVRLTSHFCPSIDTIHLLSRFGILFGNESLAGTTTTTGPGAGIRGTTMMIWIADCGLRRRSQKTVAYSSLQ
jgi:hypothetical protein